MTSFTLAGRPRASVQALETTQSSLYRWAPGGRAVIGKKGYYDVPFIKTDILEPQSCHRIPQMVCYDRDCGSMEVSSRRGD